MTALTGTCSSATGVKSGAAPSLNFQTYSIEGTYTYTCPDSKQTVNTVLNETDGGRKTVTTTNYNTLNAGKPEQVTVI